MMKEIVIDTNQLLQYDRIEYQKMQTTIKLQQQYTSYSRSIVSSFGFRYL